MNFIGFIDDQIAKEQESPEWINGWNMRIAVRGVLLDEENKIALMHIKSRNIYKLPGGGVDDEENLENALEREMLEETGCTTKPICDLGIFLEKRETWKMFQVSFVYVLRVVEKGELILTEEEKAEGFALEWVDNIEKAIELVSNSPTTNNPYDDQYMKLRDRKILLDAQKIINEKPEIVG